MKGAIPRLKQLCLQCFLRVWYRMTIHETECSESTDDRTDCHYARVFGVALVGNFAAPIFDCGACVFHRRNYRRR